MTRIKFVEPGGRERVVDAEDGANLMRIAVDSGIDGIIGDCGGNCSCGTCHCYIDDPSSVRLAVPEEMERAMLDAVLNVEPGSRLSCQIRVTPEMDGLVVRIPASQV